MSRENHENLSTADLVAGTEAQRVDPHIGQDARAYQREPLPQDAGRTMRGEYRPAEGDLPMQGEAMQQPTQDMSSHQVEQLAALFPPGVAEDFRNRWDSVQIGFVDDPRQVVRQADELVAQVMKTLAASFAEQRSRLEAGLMQGDQGNTEDLRMALRGYRSFFQRLLSL